MFSSNQLALSRLIYEILTTFCHCWWPHCCAHGWIRLPSSMACMECFLL